MMAKKKIIKALAVLALILSSCATDDMVMPDDTTIRLSVACHAPTRGTSVSESQKTVFDANAKLNVTIETSDNTKICDGVIFTASAPSSGKNTLTPPDVSRPPYYPNGDKTISIWAYYPSTVSKSSTKFSVQEIQTTNNDDETQDSYKLSDLMTATVTGVTKSTNAVNLEFQHRMAKIVISAAVSGNDPLIIQSINLANVQTEATYDSTHDTWSGSGTTGTITLATDGDGTTLSGMALFPAQKIEGKTFIQVVTDKGTANYAVTSKDFREGYEYTAELTVGMQNLTMTAAITDWSAASGTATVTKINKFGMYIEPISESFIYDGTEKVLEDVSVKYRAQGAEPKTLVKGTDYTLSFYNNVNVGDALVVAEGLRSDNGDFSGSAAVQSYIIGQASPSMILTNTGTIVREYAWNDSYTNTLTSNSKYDGVVSWSSSDLSVATVDGNGVVTITKPGTVIIKVENDGTGNYEATSAQYTLNITKRSVRDHVTITEFGEFDAIYNGTEKKPVPVVWDGGKRLGDNEGFYTIAYNNNINAGTGTASVTITGTGIYYDNTTASRTFDINKVTPVITMSTEARTIGIGTTYECDATSTYGNVSYSSSDATIASVNSSTGVVSAIKAGTVTITASVAAGDNWNAATSKTISITVRKQEESWNTPNIESTYTCPSTAIYTFEVVGAAGANWNGGKGGFGGIVKASKRLEAGTTVYIYVGGAGTGGYSQTGGQNGSDTGYGGKGGAGGGGSGGACSEIRIGGNAVANRQIVAGGGGGSSGKRRAGKDGGSSSSGNYSQSYGENVTFTSEGGGGGGGYLGGKQGNWMGGGYGGSNYSASGWTIIRTGVSDNGPSNSNDNTIYNGYVKVTYEFE